MSETNKHRNLFLPYIMGTGLDIGFGGSPIKPEAITFDLPKNQRYSFVGEHIQNIEGSGDNLFMFADNGLDFVFSSHLIEDFEDIFPVLKEWIRVIKIGGYLNLLFPDQQEYEKITKCLNTQHKHKYFGLQFVLNVLEEFENIEIIEAKELFSNNDYNCMVIVRKLNKGL